MPNKQGTPTEVEVLRRQVAELIEERAHLSGKLVMLESVFNLLQGGGNRSQQHQDPSSNEVAQLNSLTLKQRAVALGVCAGFTAKQIGEYMDVNVSTIKLHILSMARKFGLDGKEALRQRFAPVILPMPDDVFERNIGMPREWWKLPLSHPIMHELTEKRHSAAVAPIKSRVASKSRSKR